MSSPVFKSSDLKPENLTLRQEGPFSKPFNLQWVIQQDLIFSHTQASCQVSRNGASQSSAACELSDVTGSSTLQWHSDSAAVVAMQHRSGVAAYVDEGIPSS